MCIGLRGNNLRRFVSVRAGSGMAPKKGPTTATTQDLHRVATTGLILISAISSTFLIAILFSLSPPPLPFSFCLVRLLSLKSNAEKIISPICNKNFFLETVLCERVPFPIFCRSLSLQGSLSPKLKKSPSFRSQTNRVETEILFPLSADLPAGHGQTRPPHYFSFDEFLDEQLRFFF